MLAFLSWDWLMAYSQSASLALDTRAAFHAAHDILGHPFDKGCIQPIPRQRNRSPRRDRHRQGHGVYGSYW